MQLKITLLPNLVFSVAMVIVSGAVIAETGNTTPQLHITDITESSHPFQTLHCARQPVQLRFIGQLVEVVVNDESRVLMRARSASGARYVAPGDDTTEFWSKGPLATITWSGQVLPLCAPSGTIIAPYRASGNEPFWSVTYDGWQATLRRPGEKDLIGDAHIDSDATSARRQTLVAGKHESTWQLDVTEGLCVDDMSGMTHPQHATLQFQSDTQYGCGGDPERLLQGVTWRVTHIGTHTLDSDAEAHLRFLANNKITGNSGCNRFAGQYNLTGESLTVEGIGHTRMACPAELGIQENALLKALATVNRHSFEESDAQHLLLHANGTDIRLEAQGN